MTDAVVKLRLLTQNGFEMPQFRQPVQNEYTMATAVDQTRLLMSHAIRLGFSLDPTASMKVADLIGNTQVGFRANGESGASQDGDMLIAPLEGGENPSFVCCTSDSIGQEYMNISAAADVYADIVRTHESVVPDSTERLLFFANLKSENLRNLKAIQLALARRILKYCVIPDSAIDDELASRLFFDEYMAANSSNVDSSVNIDKVDEIRGLYTESRTALRILRQEVWSKVFFPVMGIDKYKHRFFYGYYRSAVKANGGHTITFDEATYPNLNEDTVRQGLVAVLGVGKTILRAL
jgi:hypothetical protein